jgi:hypothetical protein
MRPLHSLHRVVALLLGLVLLLGGTSRVGRAHAAHGEDGRGEVVAGATPADGRHHQGGSTAPDSEPCSSCPDDTPSSCAIPSALGGCAAAMCIAVAMNAPARVEVAMPALHVAAPRSLGAPTRQASGPDVPPPRA